MTTTPYPPRKRRRKRRLKKKIRIGLIILCTGAALTGVWEMADYIQPLANELHMPVLASLGTADYPGKTSSTSTEDLKKTSAQDAAADSSSADSSTETTPDPTKPYTREDGLTVYPEENTVAVIMLDPGHGNMDPGNVATNPITGEEYYEKDINLKISQLVQKKIEETNPNIQIYTTRDGDDFEFESSEDDLTRRVNEQNEIMNNGGLDYFISIHCNAMPQQDEGTSGYSFYLKPDDAATMTMTENISEDLQKQGWSHEQGTLLTVGSNSLQVVSFSPTHAMLIETGYMTNSEELDGLLNDKTIDKIATGIAAGISDTIMENPEASDTPCPEQVIPGAVNPSKPNATATQTSSQTSSTATGAAA